VGINRDVKICLEYKLKEPRKYMTGGDVGKALRQAMRSLDAGESQMLIRNALFND